MVDFNAKKTEQKLSNNFSSDELMLCVSITENRMVNRNNF